MTGVYVLPVSGAASLRARKLLGCALFAIGSAAGAPAAFAANECGPIVAGAVTCTAASFANGVTYLGTTDTTVTIAPDATIATTADATNGISISGTGTTTLAGTANVTTSGANSNGVVVVGTGPVSASTGTISTSGANATGIAAISTGTGAVAVNAGQVTVTGSGGNGIFAAAANGPVTVTTTGVSTTDATAISAQSPNSTATVNINGGTVASQAFDGIDIGSATGSTVNVNSGTLSGGAAAIFSSGAGPVTVNNSGTINGALLLAASPATVNNNGTFNAMGNSTFGAGSVFNNAGTLTVGRGAAAPVAVTMTGLTTFNNTGMIDLRNGIAGDTLTLPGNYNGSGNARLAIDAGTAVDRLAIGGSATGSTGIVVNQLAGVDARFGTTAIVQAGAGSSAGAFYVAPGSDAGLVGYDAVYDPATGAYSVVASPSDAAYGMMRYGTAEKNLWNNSADQVSAHLQARRDSLWAQGEGGASGKFWMTMSGSVQHMRGFRDFSTLGQSRVTDTAYDQDFFGAQLGLDVGGGVGSRGGFAFGVTGGYTNSKLKLGGGADGVKFDALNGGAYASFTSGNLFINGLAKYDYYWADAQSAAAGLDRRLHGHAWGARGEVGLRLGNDHMFIEPLAQISWVDSSFNGFTFQGTSVDFDQRDGWRGKAGGRIGGVTSLDSATRVSYYAGASYVHEFRREGDVTFSNAGGTYRVAGLRMPDAVEGVAGVTIDTGRAVSGFFQGSYTHSFHNNVTTGQKLEGYGVRAGINLRF